MKAWSILMRALYVVVEGSLKSMASKTRPSTKVREALEEAGAILHHCRSRHLAQTQI